jgi:hypothetical protein
VRGRIDRHLLQPGAGAPLAIAAALGGRAGAVETLDQVVSDLFELGHVRHMALGPKKRMGGLAGLAGVCRVGGELSLETRDLAAKLLSTEALVALNRGHLRLLSAVHGGRIALEPLGAGGVDRPREVARIDPALPGAVHGLRGEPLEIRRAGGILGDERPEPVAGGDEPVLHQPVVDRPSGVDVDAGAGRELANAGQPVAGTELTARDQHP